MLPDLGGGGARRVMLELAKGLDPRIFDVTLVVFGGSQILADQIPAGMRVIRLGAGSCDEPYRAWSAASGDCEPAIIISVMGYINLAVLAASDAEGQSAHHRTRGQRRRRHACSTAGLAARTVAVPPPLSPCGCDHRADLFHRRGACRWSLRRGHGLWFSAIPSTKHRCAFAPPRRTARLAKGLSWSAPGD